MRRTFLVLVSLPLALVACNTAKDPDSDSAPRESNLGLAAELVFGTGRLRLVAASELRGDLTGDGDEQDAVLQILDLESGGLVNTGLALDSSVRNVVPPPAVACGDTLVACLVSEIETGREIDGDGIGSEVLSVVFDRRTGAVTPLSFAHVAVAVDGDIAAFLALEGNLVLRVFDARDGSLEGLEAAHGLADLRDGLVVFTLDEVGTFDFNGDGDDSDVSVVWIYDTEGRRFVNTTFPAHGGRAQIADGFVGFAVSEAEQGGQDLDGDGDGNDTVFVAVDPRSGLTRVPGFTDPLFLDELERDGTRFLLSTTEVHGDRNGDGDVLDRIALVYDPPSERVIDPGVASSNRLILSGPWLGLEVEEWGEGLDLDGDGELFSTVLHAFDTRTGALANLGLRGFWVAGPDGHLLGNAIEGGSDFITGQELVSWSSDTGALRRTGFDPLLLHGTAGGRALFSVHEGERDLNGDGDVLDRVLAWFDVRTSKVRDLGLAVVGETHLDAGGRAAVLVSEADQGRDLDGDGELFSQVLYALDLRP